MDSKILILGFVGVAAILAVLFALPAETDGPVGGEQPLPVENESGTPEENETEPGPAYQASISTDKQAYKSRETIQMEVRLTVPEDREDAEIKLFGIKNKYGAYKVKRGLDTDLVEGENTIKANATVPSCYGCSGIEPGTFQMTVVLYDDLDNEIINASTGIEILA